MAKGKKWCVWSRAGGEWHLVRALGTVEPVYFMARHEARYFANHQKDYFENPRRLYRVLPAGRRPRSVTK